MQKRTTGVTLVTLAKCYIGYKILQEAMLIVGYALVCYGVYRIVWSTVSIFGLH